MRVNALALALLSARASGSVDFETESIVTDAAASDVPPLWLVLPLLLDVQPALLRLDVKRHVPAQLQSFCSAHNLDVTRCGGAVRQALDEVVNFQRFCRENQAEEKLPGFVVARNVLRGAEATASWMQNDSEDIALDLCSFVQQHLELEEEAGACVEALESALSKSFEWMLTLSPCGDWSEGNEEVSGGEEGAAISERLVTIEQMIAALKHAPPKEIDSLDTAGGATDTALFYESGVVEEISESEEPPADEGDNTNRMDEEEQLSVPVDDTAVASEAEPIDAMDDDTQCRADALELTCGSDTEEAPHLVEVDEISAVEAVIDPANEEEEMADTTRWDADTDSGSISTTEKTEEGNSSCEAVYPTIFDEELLRIGEELQAHQAWKVVLTCALALSVVYVVVDILVSCLHLAVSVPKQLLALCLNVVSLLVHGGPQSTLSDDHVAADNVRNGDEVLELPEMPVAIEPVGNESSTGIVDDSTAETAPQEAAEATESSNEASPTASTSSENEIGTQEEGDMTLETENVEGGSELPSQAGEEVQVAEGNEILVDTDEAALEEPMAEQVQVTSTQPAVETTIANVERVRNIGSTSILTRPSAFPSLHSTSLRPSSTSFTCLAMVLLVGSHAPVLLRRGSPARGNFALNCSEVVNLIRQRNRRERAAVRRIQRAWKATRLHHTSEQAEPATESSSLLEEVLRSEIRTHAPVFRLIQFKSTLRAPNHAPGFHHLIPNVLPPV